MKNIGIYIHIPFCKSKCFYCDFYSKSDCKENKINEYIDAVIKEFLGNTELLQERKIRTVYFGGGTPSLIDTKFITKIIDVIHLFEPEIEEVTIEANPESLTLEKLEEYRALGINRLSLGLQSVNNTTLKNIGRIATVEMFEEAYNNAVKAGFTNISSDLIIGLPNETLKDFERSVDFLLTKKNIKHISAYSLEVHENTKLDFLINNGFLELPSEELEREMKYLLDKKLENNGYIRYEISNYAKQGYNSKHNLSYWNQIEYIGLGAGAASFVNSTRYTNISDIDKYIEYMQDGISIKEEVEEMNKLDLIKEYVILRLRLKDGLVINDFKERFKQDIYELYKDKIAKLVNEGLLKDDGNSISLTYKGEDLANRVWQEFI